MNDINENLPTNGNNKTDIDFFTIATTGNATDFGDLSGGSGANGAVSNSHGGLAA